MEKNEFRDAVVLVTGAAGGIGRAICGRFKAAGARVYPTDRVLVENEVHFIQGDLADPAFPAQCVRRITDETGRLDVLVNNAGVCPRTALPDVGAAEWTQVMNVNLTSAFLLGQACIEVMIQQQSGVIINIASMAGKLGGITVGAHYSASKAALICLTKTFAKHGAPHGVRANAVAPGVIDTAILRAATAEQRQALLESIPLGHIAEPDQVAGPVLFLCSKDASYITGATLDVNGGFLMD